jgi:adenine-specific DNA-methyltransferase
MAFPEYDDGLEHSIWLTMMRDRLELIRDLLAKDGSIWCEIDDTEFGYLSVLMDEVFGRANRIAVVSIRRSAGTGHKAINPGPINVTDFLLGYARNRPHWKYRPQLVLREEYDKAYDKWIADIDGDPTAWKLEPLPEIFAKAKGFETARGARQVMGAAAFKSAMYTFALENHGNVVRLAIPNYQGVSQAAREAIDLSREDDAIYHLPRAEHSDMYFHRGNRILFLSDKVQADGDEAPTLAEKLTNFWDDISWQGIAREGAVDFPKNKKPERLLRRIISMGTEPGDVVLDSFAGSGTTGAVAHKMGRRWIMVEMGEQAETLAMPRLQRVVDGSDASGVTRLEAWQGGGGFRYMAVGEPLISREPELGLSVINPAYANGLLVHAVCIREGFVPTGDEQLHGRGGDSAFAHVTEELVTADYLDLVMSSLPDNSSLAVYCTSHVPNLQPAPNVVIRRLPHDLASRYCDSGDEPR